MSEAESIFNPKDESLEKRIKAYYSVCCDYIRVQSSLEHIQAGRGTSYLGEYNEVASADQTINQSIERASCEVSNEDLITAKELGIISEKQLLEMVRVQRQVSLNTARKNSRDTENSNSRLRR